MKLISNRRRARRARLFLYQAILFGMTGVQMETLKDRVAFVTGGASGIGLGISKAMVAAGMRVVIADVREDHLKDARAWFVSQHLSRRVKCLKLDVTNRKGMRAPPTRRRRPSARSSAGQHGLPRAAGRHRQDEDDWDWGLSVMIGGVVNGLLTICRAFAHTASGHVVNTASMRRSFRFPTARSTSRPSRRSSVCPNAWRANWRPTRLESRRSVLVPY
jgi:NADP-dependent 3-hydroxy acid dehydrogenase YdfG